VRSAGLTIDQRFARKMTIVDVAEQT
jgi:hypothetical protein